MFNKTKRIERFVKKVVDNLPLYSSMLDDGVYLTGSKYRIELDQHEEVFYLKLFYEGQIEWSSTDDLFFYATDAFSKINFRFQGITHYQDNHEICLTFLKNA